MAMPSNRSSSSSLAAASSRSNPNLRNSEISNAVRRSFSGNPFHKPSIISNPRSFNPNTPANSPSDFPRRNSIGGKESIESLGNLDDKENGKEHILKSSKVRSPAASMKGMKNFMSPTISASSKITESPRKKVLTDRNEPARTSFSSTEVKSPNRKVTFADSLDENKFQTFSDGIIKEEVDKHKSPTRKVTFADSVEEKTFQPWFDELVEEDSEEHAAYMVSEDLKAEARSPSRKLHPFTDGIIKDDMEEHMSSMVSEDLEAEGLNSMNETESAFEPVTSAPDFVNLDPSFRLSPTPPPFSSTSTIIAPLDADPLIPPYDPKDDPLILPYDPKVNYLSPRPQFLRYKPNPRLQLYRERKSTKLDDGLSDTELTEEASSGGSEKESEVSSDEILSEDQNHVSEASTLMSEEEIAEAKGVAKPGFSMRSKAIALLLLLSIACFSFSNTNPQVFDPFFKELATWSQTCDSSEFYQFATANFDRFSELAKENLDILTGNFHIWFTKLMSSTSKLEPSFIGVQNSGHLHHWNLTELTENIEVYQFPIFGHDGNLIREALQLDMPVLNVEDADDFTDTSTQDDIGDIIMADHYASAYEEQEVAVQELEPVPPITDDNDAAKEIDTDGVVIAEVEIASSASKIGEFAQVGEPNKSESNTDFSDSETHEIHAEVESASSASNIEVSEPNQSEGNTEVESASSDEVSESSQSESNAETQEIHTEKFEANNLQAKQAPNKDATGIVDLQDQSDLNSEVAETTEIHSDSEPSSEIHTKVHHDVQLKSEEKSLGTVIAASILLFLSIISGAAFKFLKKEDVGRRTRADTTTTASSMEQPPSTKPLHKEEASSLEKPFLRNNPIEMDVLGESCPSEMSSFEKSSSYYCSQRVEKEQNEAQSMEKKKPKRNYRRESLASSSDSMGGGSASYGSFTTYEKISNKHGHGDGGTVTTVTPVRRSSRIRSLAGSPS
ncbi:uncharacterized protein LOC129293988 [Prosopis cineraria]|uniref:uncharacterized protein LOC129293988 n=1 Tax=Prosopis cineraria TaxID=364024 RepID=UPI00240FC059|nr:uncharacterized protein LOC129293988 [Prosopis cineraria]